MGVDSSIQLNEAIAGFTTVKALLSRLVASQEEMITEIPDKIVKEFYLVANINLNLKIKVFERLSPLKISIFYPDKQAQKSVSLYYSHDTKEPGPHAKEDMIHNPTTFPITGHTDAKGKSVFDK